MSAAYVSLFEVLPGFQEEFRSLLRLHSSWLEQRLAGLHPTIWVARLHFAGRQTGQVSVHVIFPTTAARAAALDDVLQDEENPLRLALDAPAPPAVRVGQALYRSLEPDPVPRAASPFVALLGFQPLPGRRAEAIEALTAQLARLAKTADAAIDAEPRLYELEHSGNEWGHIVLAIAVQKMADYDRLQAYQRSPADDPLTAAIDAGALAPVSSAVLATYPIARP